METLKPLVAEKTQICEEYVDYTIHTTYAGRNWSITFWYDREIGGWLSANEAIYRDTLADGKTPFENESKSVPNELRRAVQETIDKTIASMYD